MLTQRTKTWNKCAWVLCRWVNLTHTNESFCSRICCRSYWFASGAAGVPGFAAAAACNRHSSRSVAGAFVLAALWPAVVALPGDAVVAAPRAVVAAGGTLLWDRDTFAIQAKSSLRCYAAGRSVQPARAEARIPRARRGRQTDVSQRCPKTARKQAFWIMRIWKTKVDARSNFRFTSS